jgi:hypothetical protein
VTRVTFNNKLGVSGIIKFNVKSLILAFCVLGGMVTAGVASAIPERYVIELTTGQKIYNV